jgi:signal-transduction protein with cAMP-binding, CBS, and nucleotidyltransferase domain
VKAKTVRKLLGVVKAMSEIGLRTRMVVKDVMSSPVVTLDEDAPSNKVANLMDDNDLGCVIVTNKAGKPLGIITERDLVIRVLAKNLVPDAVKAKEIMTSPLVTIDPEAMINEAARRMSRLNIRRLGVVYKGNLVGLVSSKDILGVMPELIEIIQERTRIEGAAQAEETSEAEETSLSGYCDRCGVFSENLKDVNGQNLCEDCRLELET